MYATENILTSLGIDLQIDDNPQRIKENSSIFATMPVDERTITPFNTLAGGASLALAECLAGYGSTLLCDKNTIPNGIQVCGNHIASVKFERGKEEKVTAKADIIHKGRTTHLWNIDIMDSNNRLISSVRVTNLIRLCS